MIQVLLGEEGNISYKENKILNFVLSKYELKVNDIHKYRDMYRIECPDKEVCLKRVKHGKNTILNRNYLMENLQSSGFNNIERLLKTKEGNLFVRSHKYMFYISEYKYGEECDLTNISEAVKCACLLGKLHSLFNNIETRGLKLKSKLEDLPKVFYDRLLNMEKFKQIIEKKRIKNDFDLMYSNYIDNFYSIGTMALNMLNNSNFYNLTKETEIKKRISIGDAYSHSVKKNSGDCFIVELNNINMDIQIMDLAKLISNLMYKQHYQWDFNKAKQIIEGYAASKPLNKKDLELILAVIIFPHKFWKLGKKRYIKQKGWSEPKYIRKIKRLIDCFDLQQKFFSDYMNFINSWTVQF